jgi:hypothetical protein
MPTPEPTIIQRIVAENAKMPVVDANGKPVAPETGAWVWIVDPTTGFPRKVLQTIGTDPPDAA